MAKTEKTNTNTKPATRPTTRPTTRVGIVESDKRDKTRTVVCANVAMHPKYGKFVRTRTVLHVHDENNTCRLGDLVEVKPCRPMSKTKRWALVKVVQQGVGLRFEGVDAPATSDKPAAPAANTVKTVKPVKK